MANERFFSVRHPSAHATDKRYGLLVMSAAATSWPIPQEWQGQLVAITPSGTGIAYSVTETAQTINPAATSDPNGVMSAVAGFPIANGAVIDRALNGKFLNWAPLAGGSGAVVAYISTELIKPVP